MVCANPTTVFFPITLTVTNSITEMDVARTMGPGLAAQRSAKKLLNGHSPDFFIEYLTQNEICI